MKKKLLPTFLALTAALTLLPVPAFAAEGDAAAAKDIAQYAGRGYPSLTAAIAEASKATGTGEKTVMLIDDVTEDVRIAADAVVTLDLNGKTLTNAKGHTIQNEGTLTIKNTAADTDSGIVDSVIDRKAALYNTGMVTILGGNFRRSLEDGRQNAENMEEGSIPNSYCTIYNRGGMTFGSEEKDEAITVENSGSYSPNVNNKGNGSAEGKQADLTIYSGTFVGGVNVIKNDDYGELTIHGGEFSGVKRAEGDAEAPAAGTTVIQNWNVAAIDGGTFCADGSSYVIANGSTKMPKVQDSDKGQLTISGGTFRQENSTNLLARGVDNGFRTTGWIKIEGGTFTGAKMDVPNITVGEDQISYDMDSTVSKPAYRLEITGGTFSTGLTAGLEKYLGSADGEASEGEETSGSGDTPETEGKPDGEGAPDADGTVYAFTADENGETSTVQKVTPAASVAITLNVTDEVQTGSKLPAAITDVEGVAVTTDWAGPDEAEADKPVKDEDGMYTAKAEGVHTAAITITAKDGKALDKNLVYTLNGEKVTLNENGEVSARLTLTVQPVQTEQPAAAETFEVTFQPGDENAQGEMEKTQGTARYTLPECGFWVEGKTFAGWLVDDADETQPAGTAVSLSGDATLTAAWTAAADEAEPVETDE